MIEDELQAWFRAGLEAAAPELGLDGELPEPEVMEPRQKEHGDFATNIALAVASGIAASPRTVAKAIVAALPPAPFVRKVEVAGPGFINVFVTEGWLHDVLRRIAAEGTSYGTAPRTQQRVQVEFVSANPTGPLHVGHARNAVLGDTIARLLDAAGCVVEREYYYNDAGGQMDRFGASVDASYLTHLGRPTEVPEDGYHGAYIDDLGRELAEREPSWAALPDEERLAVVRAAAAERVLGWIDETLARFNVRFDSYVSEAALERKGEIAQAIERLRAAGLAYEAEGAVWFRSTEFGDDKDRVLIRSDGRHTYFGADCAYVIDKFARGFDHLIYVWGADQHGDIARVRGAAQGLGFDPDAVEIVIYQWVSFLRGGDPVPMSKRAGTFVSLDELIDEVGTDAARFHLLLFGNDHTMRFDIEAVKRRSMDNPVYYVQYGHARIASILRTARDAGVTLRPIDEVDVSILVEPAEIELLKALADVPELIAKAATLRAPHRVAHASQDLAARFHRFYTECRVVSDDAARTQARLWLCRASGTVLANLLGILGVSAPDRMDRVEGSA
ncbi:MAG TPA: arginine--tRNA ligase [Actinomycetota bacterium]|nr:arginine--tRNA ligase [Actinomycetota bacterium]